MTDVNEYKKAINGFGMDNPFLKEKSKLKYVGKKYFQQNRQIGVPMVVNEFRDGEFKTLFVGSVSE